MSVKRYEGMIGKVYGELDVLRVNRIEGSRAYLDCTCSCGNSAIVRDDNIRTGAVRSCGCRQIEVSRKNQLSSGGFNKHKGW